MIKRNNKKHIDTGHHEHHDTPTVHPDAGHNPDSTPGSAKRNHHKNDTNKQIRRNKTVKTSALATFTALGLLLIVIASSAISTNANIIGINSRILNIDQRAIRGINVIAEPVINVESIDQIDGCIVSKQVIGNNAQIIDNIEDIQLIGDRAILISRSENIAPERNIRIAKLIRGNRINIG